MLHTLIDILDYSKLAVRWIPHEISEVQQWYHYAVAQTMLDRYQQEGDDFLGQIAVMDETWARSYEQNLKRQSNGLTHAGSPRPKRVSPTQCTVKVMFIVACDIDGIILLHAVPPRQTINAAYYCTFLQRYFRPAVRRKRRHLVVQNPIILHDNARTHTAATIMDLLRRWK